MTLAACASSNTGRTRRLPDLLGKLLPLARYALYAQNLEILVAPTWDCGDEWIASMRHIAREGGRWVFATGTAIRGRMRRVIFPGRDRLFTDSEEWLCDGGALIVRPFGKIEAGPHNRDKSILYCDIDPSAAPRSRRSLDVTGHYARPDIFSLQINRMTLHPLSFETAEIHDAEVRALDEIG